MGIIKGLSRLGVLLTSLGVIAVSFAGTAPASLAMVAPPDGPGGADGTGFGGPAPWFILSWWAVCPAGRSR